MGKQKSKKIRVKKVLKSKYAFDSEQGEKLFRVIYKALKINPKVKIDFKFIEVVSNDFLLTAIAPLIDYYSIDKLNKSVKFQNITNEVKERIVYINKKYYAEKDIS